MTQRRAPAGGYSFDAKDEYRRFVWNAFRDYSGEGNKTALLMPSIEGFEIETAISRGWSESELHVVDYNPAIVATLKRRYPGVTTHGIPVERAFLRLSRRGQFLACANLDYTSNTSNALLDSLSTIAGAGVLRDGALLGVTVLRGREMFDRIGKLRPGAADIIRDRAREHEAVNRLRKMCPVLGGIRLNDADMLRLALVSLALWLHAPGPASSIGYYRPVKCGAYLSSSGQTMLWIVFQFRSHEWVASTLDRVMRLCAHGQRDLAKRLKRDVDMTIRSQLMAAVQSPLEESSEAGVGRPLDA